MTGGVVLVPSSGCRGGEGKRVTKVEEEEEEVEGQNLLALLLAAIRRSMLSSCRLERHAAEAADDGVLAPLEHMEIGWPTDVQHVTHVTFDPFHGFLGLPVELELEVPGRVPSASASVFGVSAESMQCSYDSKGNSVPTILLLMQERLYSQGGLKAEGIFRINPENSQEEHVREQLNQGRIPEDIDVHCLAGLIKAWFRELPAGVLDGLSPEQVLQSNIEEECVELVKLLLPTQAALLNWAIELMADVVEEEEINKMNARNIAMVFAPNMTQMSDPLTALMHAVQVMNLLKTLILKTLREREEAVMSGYSTFSCSPSVDHQGGDDNNSQRDMDMSDESRETSSDDEHESYVHHEVEVSGESERHVSGRHRISLHYSSDDENDSLENIEECFLRQLDWKGEDGNPGEDSICNCLSSSSQVTQLTCSDFNVESRLSISAKQESLSTNDESDSEPSITRYADLDTKNLLKHKDSNEKEMVDCKLISCN